MQEKKEVQLLVAYKMLILHGYISKKTNKKQTQANESTSTSTWLLYEVCNLISIMGIYETRKTQGSDFEQILEMKNFDHPNEYHDEIV